MGNMRISNSSTTNMTDNVSDYSVDSAQQDVPSNDYTCSWSNWFGYYKVIPEIQAVIDAKARWTTGKGYKTDNKTKKILEKIRGNGKDTFDDILYNAVRVYTIGGDFFAEIIKTKRGELRNLKPINPGSITIKTNASGIITGYEQNIISSGKKIRFNPDEILHLSWNRLGDECHGISTIQKMEDIIKMRNEAMADLRLVFHRYVKPLLITQVDTDDATEIAALKVKLDNCVANGENMIIPKDSVNVDRVSIPQYSTLDPLPWIQELQKFFIMAEGVPEIILGYGSDTTEASSKIMYLAFQQMVEHNQDFLEKQIKAQLDIELELEFPADLMENVQETESKAGNKKAVQPEDTKVKI
jgi:hypothetical protein